MTTREQVVERVAQRICAADPYTDEEWETTREDGRQYYRHLARAALSGCERSRKPPILSDETLAAIETAVIEVSGNGEFAAYVVKYLRGR